MGYKILGHIEIVVKEVLYSQQLFYKRNRVNHTYQNYNLLINSQLNGHTDRVICVTIRTHSQEEEENRCIS